MAIQPVLEILLANLIWGFGFVATVWTLESFSWSQIFLYRILLAGLAGFIIYLIFSRKTFKKYVKIAFLPSIFLGLEIICQIFSLQYTKATEGGFLFVTYIIMIPVMEFLLFRKRLPKSHFLWIVLGIVGSALMVNSDGGMSLGTGEVSMLLSAFFASSHVIAIDRIDKSEISSFYLNTFQLLWGILITSPFLFMIDHKTISPVHAKSIAGLLCLAFGSTMLAYFLQIKAQLKIPPAMISILFLVESAFAAVFAFVLLGETITYMQWLGAFIICFSAVAVSFGFFKSLAD